MSPRCLLVLFTCSRLPARTRAQVLVLGGNPMRRVVFLAVLAATLLPAATAFGRNAGRKAMAQQIGSHLKQSGQLHNYRIGVKYPRRRRVPGRQRHERRAARYRRSAGAASQGRLARRLQARNPERKRVEVRQRRTERRRQPPASRPTRWTELRTKALEDDSIERDACIPAITAQPQAMPMPATIR